MSGDYTVTTPLKVEQDGGVGAAFRTIVSPSATGDVSITSVQTAGNFALTLANPTAGQALIADSTTTGLWKNPVDVKDTGVSLNAANFRAVSFTGAVTVSDLGSGVAEVDVSGVATKQFHAYDSSGGQSPTSALTLLYNTVTRNTGEFSLASGEVTVNSADHYLIAYTVTTDINSGNQAAVTSAVLQVDTGAGYVDIPGTTTYRYNNTSATGEQSGSTSTIYNTAVGDKFRVRVARHAGTGDAVTRAQASNITFANTGGVGQFSVGNNTIMVEDSGVALGGTYDTLDFVGDISAVDQGGGTAEIRVTFPTPTINVKEEGAAVGTFDTLNFVGGDITATNAGGGQANITLSLTNPGIAVEDEGSSVGTGFTLLNFIGAGVTATNAGGNEANITIPGNVTIENENVALGTFSVLNFEGATVTATNAGGGQADITISPTIEVEDEGSSIGVFDTINFVGAGVTAVDSTGGRTTVTIPGGGSGVTVKDESTTLGTFTILNFTGSGVTATDAGSGQANITIPSGGTGGTVDVAEEGSVLGAFSQINFIGSAITATNGGGGTANVTVVVPTSTIAVKEEAAALGSFNTFNFVGGLITATNAGGGQANVTVATPTVGVEEEGSSLGQFDTLNFIGAGVTATNAGGGQANITVDTNIAVEDDDVSVGSFSVLNFVNDISAANAGGGQVNITVDTTKEVKENGTSEGFFDIFNFKPPITVTASGLTADIDPRIPVEQDGTLIGRFARINITGSIPVVTDSGGDEVEIYIDESGLAGTIGICVFSDVKPTGTNGGDISNAQLLTWVKRDLNTADAGNNITGVTLNVSTSRVTMPAGTYYVWGQAPAYRVDAHRCRLFDFTNSVVAVDGSNSYSKNNANAGQAGAFFYGVIAPSSTTEYQIEHIVTTNTTAGGSDWELGIAGGFSGVAEKYTVFNILKLTTS